MISEVTEHDESMGGCCCEGGGEGGEIVELRMPMEVEEDNLFPIKLLVWLLIEPPQPGLKLGELTRISGVVDLVSE